MSMVLGVILIFILAAIDCRTQEHSSTVATTAKDEKPNQNTTGFSFTSSYFQIVQETNEETEEWLTTTFEIKPPVDVEIGYLSDFFSDMHVNLTELCREVQSWFSTGDLVQFEVKGLRGSSKRKTTLVVKNKPRYSCFCNFADSFENYFEASLPDQQWLKYVMFLLQDPTFRFFLVRQRPRLKKEILDDNSNHHTKHQNQCKLVPKPVFSTQMFQKLEIQSF